MVGRETDVSRCTSLLHRGQRKEHAGARVDTLGQLPLKGGKTLHVIAWKEPQGDLMDLIRQAAFPAASGSFSQLGLEDGEYTMSVQGYRRPDSAYMVVFPVRYTPHESADTSGTLP